MELAISVEGMGSGATGVTIGEALEAAAEVVGDKPVNQSDVAAIQIAEMIATGTNAGLGSGLGAEAQVASTIKAQMMYDEDKTKLSNVIEVLEAWLHTLNIRQKVLHRTLKISISEA